MTSLIGLWKQNLINEHKAGLEILKKEYPKKNTLTINVKNTSPELYSEIIKDPIVAEHTLYAAIMESKTIPTWNGSRHSINIRFIGFTDHIKVKELDSSKLDKFASLRVIVRKVTAVKPRIVHAAFKCNACKNQVVYIPVTEDEIIPPQDKCLCGGRSWRFMLKQSIKKDYQLITVQDPPEGGMGTKPELLTVKLIDDLTGKTQPGNIIVINGIFQGQQKKTGATLETFMDAKSIEIKNRDFTKIEILPSEIVEFENLAKRDDIYDILWSSVGRVIKGYEPVKQALLLQLLGGVEKIDEDNNRIRPDIHILLCGDPSVAKSKMLKTAYNLCPCGIYASGKSTTGPGLTAAASKGADGAWEIEAGAAVLAHKGMLVLDEMDKMEKAAIESLHEIMEEQIIHVNKAGINADLSTEEAVLAACNPKRARFDRFVDLGSQVNFAPSLLSRFGLIFLLTDEPDKKKDREIAHHIINSHRKKLDTVEFTVEKIRKYIAHAKQSCSPEITDESAQLLEDYYVKIRNKNQKSIPVTARQIEDITRLAEASAKTRLSEYVEKIDVDRAIWIYEQATRSAGLDPKTGEVDADKASGQISLSNSHDLDEISQIRFNIFTSTGSWPKKHELTDAAIAAGIESNLAISLVNALWKERNLYTF